MAKTKEISVNVSKKIGQPEFSSIMVSASITMTVEEETETKGAYLEAWATAWEEVNKQEEEIESHKEMKEVADKIPAKPDPDPIMTATTPTCPIHGNTVTYHQSGISKNTGKPYPGFYSCSARLPDGSFCKQKFS